MRHQFLLGAAAIAFVIPAAASAQETTSAIRGTVTANGAAVAGATVVATDVESNTRSQTTSDSSGNFSLQGLRAGGPYTVEITSPQGNKTVTDIYTVVQQAFTLPVELAAATDAAAGADIVVTASSIRGAGVTSDGPQTVLTQADIGKVASVNRDIRDIERRDPFATVDYQNSGDRGAAVAFAGVNPRYNRFTINGVTVGDTFGLNQDASPTNRGPVPFDAIGQVSVSIAPYDFRQSGFQGGAIDTVLLSGTNEFHGTGFYSQNTDGLSGDTVRSTKLTLPKFKSETYGATFRGPLIADKLFFMVSAERNTDPRPFSTLISSYTNPALIATAVANTVAIANAEGYKPGNILSINPRKDEKIAARIDWNIMDGQRLSLSYINAYDSLVSQNNTFTTPPLAYGLDSNAYALTELLRAGIAQLNSDWTDNLSTEIRGIYKYNKRGQEPLGGRPYGQIFVCNDVSATVSQVGTPNTSALTGCTSTIPRIAFGPDVSRQTNQLFFDTWEGSFLARYTAGSHQVQTLVDVTQNRTFNNFVQNSLGAFYFDSLNDFTNRNANTLTYAASIPGVSAAADFRYTQFTFGLQDKWQITNSLALTYGARMSLYAMGQQPVFNTYFQQRYGFTNTRTYKGLEQFEPRISFEYKPTDFLSGLKLRGGAGIFGGGSPDIYLSNSFSNTITTSSVTITRSAAGANTCTNGVPNDICIAALNGVTGTVPASVAAYAANTTNPTTLARTNTGALARDFHLPRSLKATLSADYSLFGFDLGLDYYFSKVIDGIIFTDARSVVVGKLPDGRNRYGAVTAFADANYDIILGNTGKGRSHIGVVRLQKNFDWGLSLGGTYTRASVKDVSAATSSTINSNYRYQVFADPNTPSYGISNDETKWQFTYNVGFDHKFFDDYRTVLQLFGQTRAGRPFSYTMLDTTTTRSPVFGTNLTSSIGSNLLYVPTGTSDPIVSYDSAATQSALDAYIGSTALAKYRGRIAPKNIGRNDAFTRIDLHVEQEVPTFIGKSRVTLFADINNLPNLLNKNWGSLRGLGYQSFASLVTVQCLASATPTGTAATGVVSNNTAQPCVQYRYASFVAPNLAALNFTQSTYAIRLGARFSF